MVQHPPPPGLAEPLARRRAAGEGVGRTRDPADNAGATRRPSIAIAGREEYPSRASCHHSVGVSSGAYDEGDVVDDGRELPRWMSYAELARSRGISRASAARLAQRRGWDRRIGNDGLTKVAVPAGEETPTQHDAGADAAEDGPTVEALQAELAALAMELAEERERRARAEGEAAGLRAALERVTPALEASQRDTLAAREDARGAREATQMTREEAAFLRGQLAAGDRGRAGQALIEGGYADPAIGRSPGLLRWLLHRLSAPSR